METRKEVPLSQNIGNVTGSSGAQMAVGTFYGNVNFGSAKSSGASPDGKLVACCDALFLTNPAVDRANLISTKGKRVSGTCEWVYHDPIFLQWLQGDTQLLSICGGPGKGKTMLSIYLTEKLEQSGQVMYFFCSSEDNQRNDSVCVMRGLLWKMLIIYPELAQHVAKDFETPKMAAASTTSREALWMIFVTLIKNCSAQMFCLVDGLDECDEDSAAWLITKFVDLSTSNEDSLSQGRPLRVIVVSRETRGLDQIRLRLNLDPDNDELVAHDIQKFVSDQVEHFSRLPGFDESFRREIEQGLLTRAENTFLWVGFAVREMLRKKTVGEIRAIMTQLPSGLPAIYARMLSQIELEHRECVSRILQWLALAFRPLSKEELAAALSLEATVSVDKSSISDNIVHCGLFVKEQHGKIGLIHQSAKDFLLRGSKEFIEHRPFQTHQEDGHYDKVRACLACIMQSPVQDREIDFQDAAMHNPFLQYAIVFWPSHMRHVKSRAKELLSHRIFKSNSYLLQNWYNVYRQNAERDYRMPLQCPLHIAARFGIVSWAEKLLRRRKRVLRLRRFVNMHDAGRTALQLAVDLDHYDMARLLLDHGADVNNVQTLGIAAENGSLELVRLLLDRGADIHSTDFGHGSVWHALFTAAARGLDAIVRLLLDRGVCIDIAPFRGQAPLHAAICGGFETTVRLLLDRGAIVDTRPNTWGTPLYYAASYGHSSVLRLLLSRGSDPRVNDIFGDTPLHVATENGHNAVMGLLLRDGAEVGAKNKLGDEAIHIAANTGSEAAVKLLLDHGAHCDAINDAGCSALVFGVRSGSQAVIRLLLDRGATPGASTDPMQSTPPPPLRVGKITHKPLQGDHCTGIPLHEASVRGDEAIARLLLERGASVEDLDSKGYTALYHAIRNDHAAIVRLFLDHGANTSAKDGDEMPLLHVAALYANNEVVHLLLDDGANIDALDAKGCTALHRAVQVVRLENVTALLNFGANIDAIIPATGNTVLHEIVVARDTDEGRKFDTMRCLRDRGADVTIKNNSGQTPLDLAARLQLENLILTSDDVE